ncbi:uncharacterized protein CTHT_0055900 [Thermochaetoides thermophila DSM 1495]|uniref:Secreted protein n=1 Tax=Chaetomium thermophilum (strain DSM 1495 / CBS 144.50 / IMI 039719) TaxID=759272 RepID=G0SC47_CHATD|nr:hypothetical protein CTHT_0055900 [Thermochaetoides thermophila DSM 1495]EGS18973.1 hypothetical protein CTHT_0055900 [Thermochaetoides thermophila DSM 1495]
MGLLSYLTVFLAATGSALAAPAAESPADIAVPTPKITSITYSGNGCVRDPKLSGSFNDPTFTYQGFTLSLPTNTTANCQIHIQASGAGPGWQVALKSSQVKGRLVLTPGTSLTHYTTVFFSQNPTKTSTVSGTVSNDSRNTISRSVTLVSKADSSELAWSPCTGSDGYTGIMNVNFRGVLSGNSRAYFEAQTETWELQWRRC